MKIEVRMSQSLVAAKKKIQRLQAHCGGEERGCECRKGSGILWLSCTEIYNTNKNVVVAESSQRCGRGGVALQLSWHSCPLAVSFSSFTIIW